MSFFERTKGYLLRVAKNDSTRHGIAAAGAGLVISLITEALFG